MRSKGERFCSKCGTLLENRKKRCGNCGAKRPMGIVSKILLYLAITMVTFFSLALYCYELGGKVIEANYNKSLITIEDVKVAKVIYDEFDKNTDIFIEYIIENEDVVLEVLLNIENQIEYAREVCIDIGGKTKGEGITDELYTWYLLSTVYYEDLLTSLKNLYILETEQEVEEYKKQYIKFLKHKSDIEKYEKELGIL